MVRQRAALAVGSALQPKPHSTNHACTRCGCTGDGGGGSAAPASCAGCNRLHWTCYPITHPVAAQVTVDMECSARELLWLWALQGVLEGVLIKQAHSTARAFCDFVRCRCAEHAARRDSLGQARGSALVSGNEAPRAISAVHGGLRADFAGQPLMRIVQVLEAQQRYGDMCHF